MSDERVGCLDTPHGAGALLLHAWLLYPGRIQWHSMFFLSGKPFSMQQRRLHPLSVPRCDSSAEG